MATYLPISAEALVFILGALLYLTDLGKLLGRNEVLLVCGTVGGWCAITPANGFLFNRRHAVFPRWYDPGTAVLRFRWPVRPGAERRWESTRKRLDSMWLPRSVSLVLLPEIFLLIPLAYLHPVNHLSLLTVLLLVYLQALTMVSWLFLSRTRLCIGLKDSILIAFECLVCIPYSINFYRKVAEKVSQHNDADLLDASRNLLDEALHQKLSSNILTMLDDFLDSGLAHEKIVKELHDYRARLIEVKANEHS